jgi:UDP-N-acetylmuramoyl-L-alanyl-D-glutamate--2,6-diaminopimelate ligase
VPAQIRHAILAAAPGALEIGDRRAAIETAIAGLGPGDVLVIAGKGHETGQIVGGKIHPFDDAEVAIAAVRGLGCDEAPARVHEGAA